MKLIEYLELVGQCSGRDLHELFPDLDCQELFALVRAGSVKIKTGAHGAKYYGFVDSDILEFLGAEPDMVFERDLKKATGLSTQRMRIELHELIGKGLVVRCGERYSLG